MKKLFFIALITLFVGCIKVNNAPIAEEDAALVTLLDELDKCQETGNRVITTSSFARWILKARGMRSSD